MSKPKNIFEALSMDFENSPPELQGLMNNLALEIMFVELPRFMKSLQNGPVKLRSEMTPLATVFKQAMERDEEKGLPKALRDTVTATVEDIGLELAEVLDRGVNRILLEDTDCNRLAADALLADHARIVKDLATLALSEEARKAIAEASRDAS